MAKAAENKQLEAMVAPVVAFNKLVIKNAEAAFNMQMASIKAYADLSLDNINEGLEVMNVEDFKAYAEKQKDVAEKFTAQVTADVKAFGELNSKFFEEARTLAEDAREVAEENVKAVATKVKSATAKAA